MNFSAPITKSKHIPERSCVACRRKRPQQEFWRLSKVQDHWQLQNQRTRTGRGAYLCADCPTCWQEKKLRRAFGQQAVQIAAQLEHAVLAIQNKSSQISTQDKQQTPSFKGCKATDQIMNT